MSIESLRTGEVRLKSADPRTALAQESYYTARPEPLETWLWDADIPAAAERVFWLHWREGSRNRDWCSQISVSVVASHCRVDTSTVTRAYQVLQGHGLIRRTDPGRDPSKPFSQAIAVTEVFLPRALVGQLANLPKRPHPTRSRAHEPPTQELMAPPAAAMLSQQLPAPLPAPTELTAPPKRISVRERLKQLAQMRHSFSEAEESRWKDAAYRHLPAMTFDPDTRVSVANQAEALQHLSSMARDCGQSAPAIVPMIRRDSQKPVGLSVFELARLHRSLQKITGSTDVVELLRQVSWAVEEGALKKHAPAFAINIALKKIREGAWTRPHKMPPNWVRRITDRAAPETCARA